MNVRASDNERLCTRRLLELAAALVVSCKSVGCLAVCLGVYTCSSIGVCVYLPVCMDDVRCAYVQYDKATIQPFGFI